MTGNYAANRPDRICPIGGAEQILTCNRDNGRGVFNDGEGALRTFGMSISFIGINNNFGFDRAAFLQDIIEQLAGYQGTLSGVVLNNMTGEPVEDALVSVLDCELACVTDAEGRFEIPRIPVEQFIVNVQARGYTTVDEAEFTFEGEQELEVEIRMLHPEISLNRVEVNAEVDLDDEEIIPIGLTNAGDGPLTFSARIRSIRAGAQLWDEILSIDAGREVNDERLQAAIFFQDHYWVAGGGSGAENPNVLYKLNSDGELIDQWEQGFESNFGWRDLTTDGEFIYGVEGEFIYQIDPETGRTTDVRIQSLVNPTCAVTWDPINQLFWVAGPSTNILGIDRDGNYLRVIANRNRFQFSGLAWYNDDPDGYQIYVVSTDRQLNAQILKCDWITCDAIEITYIDKGVDEMPGGGEITSELYPFTATMVLQMQGPEDWIRTYEAGTNFHWISFAPVEADVEAGGELGLDLVLNATGLVINESYTAYILFDHNTPAEGVVCIDVTMTVVHPDNVEMESVMPYSFGINSIYPNPFNPTATINFGLDHDADVELAVYDLSGRCMKQLCNAHLSAGDYSSSLVGTGLPSGVYIVRLSDGSQLDLQKVSLIR